MMEITADPTLAARSTATDAAARIAAVGSKSVGKLDAPASKDYVVEFKIAGELVGKPIPSLNVIQADSLPLAVRFVQKALDATEIESAVIYMPVRVLRASRQIAITDGFGEHVDPADRSLGLPIG